MLVFPGPIRARAATTGICLYGPRTNGFRTTARLGPTLPGAVGSFGLSSPSNLPRALSLSTDHPDPLLYGTLVEGAIFLKETPDVIAQFEARFKEAMARMKNLSEGRNTRDEFRYDLLRTGVT